ncbi:hypothetical protein AMECASPLE_026691 [Ameca splendens]|uniref:Uncharacterized protein n=1 Tax=Ameca splendens TaxID=208324 RepID=A0ABV0ZDW1_9TELE
MLRRCVAVGTDLPLAGWPQNTRVVLVVNGLHTWHIRWARSSRESRTKLPAAERLFAPSYTQENKAGDRSCDRAGCGRFDRCSYSESVAWLFRSDWTRTEEPLGALQQQQQQHGSRECNARAGQKNAALSLEKFLCKRGCPPRQQTVHKMKRSIWKKLFLLVHSLQASIYLPVHSLLSDIWSLFDRDLCVLGCQPCSAKMKDAHPQSFLSSHN